MKDPILYRRRLIPEECVLLKDDRILLHADNILVTSWQALKPRKDLHHGYSCYFFKEGYKISKFYAADNTLLYYYCDIITHDYNEKTNTLIVTDLLADVIIYPDGFVKVVDLAEISQALSANLLTIPPAPVRPPLPRRPTKPYIRRQTRRTDRPHKPLRPSPKPAPSAINPLLS